MCVCVCGGGDLCSLSSPRKGISGINCSPLYQHPKGPWGTARGFQHLPLCCREGQPLPRAACGGVGVAHRVRMVVPLPRVISSKEGTHRQARKRVEPPPSRDWRSMGSQGTDPNEMGDSRRGGKTLARHQGTEEKP